MSMCQIIQIRRSGYERGTKISRDSAVDDADVTSGARPFHNVGDEN